MRLTQRPATKDDYAFLWRLHEATMKEYVDQTWGWEETWQQQHFDAHFDPGERTIVLLDDQPVGSLIVERNDKAILLAALEITPTFQRRGIGTTVIGWLIEEGEATSLPVGLRVLKVNPARRLYERLGFTVVQETATHYVMQRTIETSP